MSLFISDHNTFKNSRVVYVDINPSKELDNFRWELSKRLKSYCKLKPIDYKRKYHFHATLAMKLNHDQFKKVKSYVNNNKYLKFKHIVVRVTLLKGQRILREYDFLLRRPLTRKLAKSRSVYRRTMGLLNKYFNENNHKKRGTIQKKRSLLKKIFGFFK